MDASLGSIQVDYDSPKPATVTQAEAEALVRRSASIPDAVTTCSVRLARYHNISARADPVWVVHLDGLSITGLSGPLPLDGRSPASPPVLRRALFIVSGDAPAKVLVSVMSGP